MRKRQERRLRKKRRIKSDATKIGALVELATQAHTELFNDQNERIAAIAEKCGLMAELNDDIGSIVEEAFRRMKIENSTTTTVGAATSTTTDYLDQLNTTEIAQQVVYHVAAATAEATASSASASEENIQREKAKRVRSKNGGVATMEDQQRYRP